MLLWRYEQNNEMTQPRRQNLCVDIPRRVCQFVHPQPDIGVNASSIAHACPHPSSPSPRSWIANQIDVVIALHTWKDRGVPWYEKEFMCNGEWKGHGQIHERLFHHAASTGVQT
jgi:hypothetical protein